MENDEMEFQENIEEEKTPKIIQNQAVFQEVKRLFTQKKEQEYEKSVYFLMLIRILLAVASYQFEATILNIMVYIG